MFFIKKILIINWFIITLLLSVNFLYWQIGFLDIIFFVLYFIFTGIALAQIFKKLLHWTSSWSLVFSFFNLLFYIGFIVAVFIDFYKLVDLFIIISLAFIGLMIWLVNIKFSENLFSWIEFQQSFKNLFLKTNSDYDNIKTNKYLLLILPFLFVLGWYLLTSARTGEYLITPWQVIPKIYIYVFLIINYIVVTLVFSKFKTWTILFFIILHSFLLHSYLPSVYETGFGGDKWRHLASERYLMQGEIYSPSLIGEEIKYTNFGNIKVPEVFIAGNKTSYGKQWGMTITLSKFLHINEFWIDYYLGFILWSIVIPLLLYKFSELIWKNKKFQLLVAFLPSLFYTLQVFGSITIPVALGSMFFFWVLYLWLKYLHEGSRKIRNFAIILSVIMYFGYILNFLLIWQIAIIILAIKLIKPRILRKIIVTLLIIIYLFSIPVLESVMGYGGLDMTKMSLNGIINAFADAFGALSGLVSFIPRPIHIDQGNWLYNQTRLTQSSASLLSLGVLPFVFTITIWGFILLSVEKIRQIKENKIIKFLGFSLLIILFNYIFSWYLMTGNHILARRLDMTIVWLLIIFLALGMFYVIESSFKIFSTYHKKIGITMFIALVTTSTYTSGPVLEVVTADEVRAAEYVWQRIDKQDHNYCVVANTWPLLGLEAVSARSIIAGGFPVYLEYAQPERVKIFEGMLKWPKRQDYFADAFQATGALECWYMLERKWVSDKVWSDTIDIIGNPDQTLGNVNIWKINK